MHGEEGGERKAKRSDVCDQERVEGAESSPLQALRRDKLSTSILPLFLCPGGDSLASPWLGCWLWRWLCK